MKLLESRKIKASKVRIGDTIKVDFSQDWRQHLKGDNGLLTVDYIDTDNDDGEEYIYFIQKKDGLTFSVTPSTIVEVV